MASDPMEPDRLREMLAAKPETTMASDTSDACANGHDWYGATCMRCRKVAGGPDETARLRERVAVLEMALRAVLETSKKRRPNHAEYGKHLCARADAALALSRSTTLAEHDAAVRRAAIEECARVCDGRARSGSWDVTKGEAQKCANQIRALAEGK